MAILFSNKVSPEFIAKLSEIAVKLGNMPSWLMYVINHETGGTFSPSVQNPSSKATGLIQFLPSTAISLGTTIEELSKMTAIEQLEFVYKYLRPYKGKMTDFYNTYLAVFYPVAIGKEDTYVFPANVVRANPSLFKHGSTKESFKRSLDDILYATVPTVFYDEFIKKKSNGIVDSVKRNALQIYQREIIITVIIIILLIAAWFVYKKI